MNRSGTPQTRWSESTTLSSAEDPLRQPPKRRAMAELVSDYLLKRLSDWGVKRI